MGLGIFSMHFLGMLALDLGRPLEIYRLELVVAVSIVAAVLGSAVALWVITRAGARRSGASSSAPATWARRSARCTTAAWPAWSSTRT